MSECDEEKVIEKLDWQFERGVGIWWDLVLSVH